FSIFTIRHPHTPLLFPYTTLFIRLSDAYYLSVPVSNEKDKAGPTAHREHILHFWLHTSGTASGRQGQRVYSTYDTYRVCSGSYRRAAELEVYRWIHWYLNSCNYPLHHGGFEYQPHWRQQGTYLDEPCRGFHELKTGCPD